MVNFKNTGGQSMSEFTMVMAALIAIATVLVILMLNNNNGALPSAETNVSDKIAND